METIKDKNVLLVDNSGKRECEIFEKKYGFQVEYQSENIGIPRSWNVGLKKGHDWTFIVSSSMLFNKPFSHIVEMLDGYEGLFFRTTHGWHLCGILMAYMITSRLSGAVQELERVGENTNIHLMILQNH